MTYVFHEFPPTRSNRAKWALEELGIPYESRRVDFITGAQRTADHLERHPLGHVPVLDGDGYRMHESVAIVMQLIDEHPEAKLAPPLGTPERALYYQWCVFGVAELDPLMAALMKHTKHLPEAERSARIAETALTAFKARAAALSDRVKDRRFLVGDMFTGADIVIGYDLNWADYIGILSDHPILVDYYARLQERPAFGRVFGERA